MYPYITFFGITIPTYGLLLTTGVVVAGAVAVRRCKRWNRSADDFFIIAACAVGLGFLFAWLLYVAVTYSPEELWNMLRSGGIGSLFNGGMVFYGGLAGGVLGALLGARLAKARLADFLNPIVPVLPLAHAFGRIGCFCAGCCYGIPTTSRLGVVYTHPAGGAPIGIPLLPVQLFEAGLNLVIFCVLLVFTRRTKSKTLVLPVYIASYGCVRFFLEFIRYDAARGALLGLSTSQWISILGVLLSAAYIAAAVIRNKRKGAEAPRA